MKARWTACVLILTLSGCLATGGDPEGNRAETGIVLPRTESPSASKSASKPAGAIASARAVPKPSAALPSTIADEPASGGATTGMAAGSKPPAAAVPAPAASTSVGGAKPEPVATVPREPRPDPAAAKPKPSADTASHATAGAEAPTTASPNPASKPSGFGEGSAAYQVPTKMVEGRNSPVDLWIDTGTSPAELRARLEGFLTATAIRAATRTGINLDAHAKDFPTTEVVARQIVVGRKMYAELSGGINFDIEPKGPREQILREGMPVSWSWLVTPKVTSAVGLPLELKVMADPGDGGTALPAIRELVIVEARPRTLRERVEEIEWWIKLLTGGGVAALAAAVWTWGRNRRASAVS